MDLIDRFIPYLLPRQYIYVSEQYLQFYAARGQGKIGRRDHAGADLPPAALTSETLQAFKTALEPGPVGLVLGPQFFIYNLFSFDRLPLKTSTRKEIVEWKLEKVFPEKIDQYHHRFFKIARHSILSILVRRDWLDRLLQPFAQAGIPLTYVGNSSLEIINRWLAGKKPPDLIIEFDRASVMIAFQKNRTLVYMRKLRTQTEADLLEEILRTLQFVAGQFHLTPKTCSIVAPGIALETENLAAAIRRWDITLLPAGKEPFPFLPVSS